MDKEFQDQFLLEYHREKNKAKTDVSHDVHSTRSTRIARSQLSRESKYGDTIIRYLYNVHKQKLPHVTYGKIASNINPLARPLLNIILTELEKEYFVESFEVRQKRVYRLSPQVCARLDEQIEELHRNRLSRIVTSSSFTQSHEEERNKEVERDTTVIKGLDVSPQEEENPPKVPTSFKDIFDSPEDYMKEKPKI